MSKNPEKLEITNRIKSEIKKLLPSCEMRNYTTEMNETAIYTITWNKKPKRIILTRETIDDLSIDTEKRNNIAIEQIKEFILKKANSKNEQDINEDWEIPTNLVDYERNK